MTSTAWMTSMFAASVALLLGSACVIVSDDASEAGETAGDGDGDGDGDASGDGDGDGAEQGGDGDGDSEDGDGDPGDGDATGDGDPGDAVSQACAAACDLLDSCAEAPDGCLENCLYSHAQHGDDPECLANELALTQCIASLDCEQLDQFLAEDPVPYPCQAEVEAICDGGSGVCSVGVGEGAGPGECSVVIECEGEPERSVECDGSECTCFVDGDAVGGCSPATEVCANPGSDGYASCCE